MAAPQRRRLLFATTADVSAVPVALGTPFGIGSNSAGSGGSTLTITTSTEIPADSAITVVSAATSGVAPTSVSGGGLTWVRKAYNSFGSNNVAIDTARTSGVVPAGTVLTITYGSTSGTKLAVGGAVSGVAASAFDVGTTANATSGTSTTPSITTAAQAQNVEAIFAYTFIASLGADAFTEDTADGFTQVSGASNNHALRLSAKNTTTSSGVTYNPTLGASKAWGQNYVTVKEGP